MYRLLSKLHISALKQSTIIYYRDFATVAVSKQRLPRSYRTPTSYALFVKENIKKNTNIPMPEQFANIGKQWKATSDGEKERLTKEATQLREQKIAEFKKLSKDQQKEKFAEVKKSNEELQHKRRFTAYRKFRKETNCPTRPLNGFMLFQQEMFPFTRKEDIGSNSKKAAEEFKKLSDEEKKPYMDKFAANLEKYKVDFEKWKKTHGADYEELKKKFASPKKANKKATGGMKKSMGLFNRLKKRASKRKAIKRKVATKSTPAIS